MNKINTKYQKAVRIQIFVCGLLFSIFSFVYVYVFQRDVLEALHFSLAHGKTHFSPLGSTLVMMLTLLLLTWGVSKLVSLKGKYHSLAYLPACFVLMATSDVGRDVYLYGGNTVWLWLLPALTAIFIGIAFWCKNSLQSKLDTEISTVGLIGSNLFFMILGIIATLFVGNTDEIFHHELEVERCLREKKYEQAMRIGERSLETSHTLTTLRAIAMSNAGQLGERLFTYPQKYGANGLFFPEDSLQTLRYTNDSIYNHLGARPYNGEGQLNYLHTLCYEDKGKFTALHYYLSALLLKKRTGAFAKVISDFFESGDTLPTHFEEAILMYKATHPEYPFMVTDSTLVQKYAAYKYLQKGFKSKTEEINQMHHKYGDTYWWYHDYQK